VAVDSAGDFAGVAAAELVAVGCCPFGEFGVSGGGGIGIEQASHEALDFFAGDDDVFDERVEALADKITEAWGNAGDEAADSDDLCDGADEFAVLEGFGADGVGVGVA